MKRKIVEIDEAKCNGCGLCVEACHEGAIEIVDGKARLVADRLCDGLGDCLGECPQGAITIIEREAEYYDEQAVTRHLARRKTTSSQHPAAAQEDEANEESELSQWPVQLLLVSPQAPYFQDADLLVTADCVPVATAGFHRKFLKNRAVVMGCPKFDNAEFYVEKMSQLIASNRLRSITIARMQVPCCGGLVRIVEAALQKANTGQQIPLRIITVSTKGEILDETLDIATA